MSPPVRSAAGLALVDDREPDHAVRVAELDPVPTSTAPEPPPAVLKSGGSCRPGSGSPSRSPLPPNPLSGIARHSPGSSPSTIAENPSTGWPCSIGERDAVGVEAIGAPDGGPRRRRSTGSTARPVEPRRLAGRAVAGRGGDAGGASTARAARTVAVGRMCLDGHGRAPLPWVGAIVRGSPSRAHRADVPSWAGRCPARPSADGTRVPCARDPVAVPSARRMGMAAARRAAGCRGASAHRSRGRLPTRRPRRRRRCALGRCRLARPTTPATNRPGENWWLVTWFVVGLAYAVAGAALLLASVAVTAPSASCSSSCHRRVADGRRSSTSVTSRPSGPPLTAAGSATPTPGPVG